MAGSEMSIQKCQQRVYKEAYVPPPPQKFSARYLEIFNRK